MKAKHTQGPWTVENCVSEELLDIILDYEVPRAASPVLIGTTFFDEKDDPEPRIKLGEAKANARLMAAAPDLLEACEAAIRTLDVAIRAGLHGWDGPTENEIVKNHSTMQVLVAAVAKAKGAP